ncbi:UNVERIFIED_CONTAM: hypothetical protein HDU68_010567 [Siphonaria sp. JEL0065]|nr:hypothetical protein HDU68_010567 [Siphonaria sp. JEL0065]
METKELLVVKRRPRNTVKQGQQQQQPRAKEFKVVVRRLPPTLSEDVFTQTVAVFDHSWCVYSKGKVSKSAAKPNTFSRAYLAFASLDQIAAFSQTYNGWLFKDGKSGTEYRAQVEMAPFQKVPRRKPRVDYRANTIDTDPEYLSFLESLNVDPKEAHAAALAAEQQSIKAKDSAAGTAAAFDPTSTPLLDDLRAKKNAMKEAAERKRESNRAKSARAKAASLEGKGQKAPKLVKLSPSRASSASSSVTTVSASSTGKPMIVEKRERRKRERRDKKSVVAPIPIAIQPLAIQKKDASASSTSATAAPAVDGRAANPAAATVPIAATLQQQSQQGSKQQQQRPPKNQKGQQQQQQQGVVPNSHTQSWQPQQPKQNASSPQQQQQQTPVGRGGGRGGRGAGRGGRGGGRNGGPQWQSELQGEVQPQWQSEPGQPAAISQPAVVQQPKQQSAPQKQQIQQQQPTARQSQPRPPRQQQQQPKQPQWQSEFQREQEWQPDYQTSGSTWQSGYDEWQPQQSIQQDYGYGAASGCEVGGQYGYQQQQYYDAVGAAANAGYDAYSDYSQQYGGAAAVGYPQGYGGGASEIGYGGQGFGGGYGGVGGPVVAGGGGASRKYVGRQQVTISAPTNTSGTSVNAGGGTSSGGYVPQVTFKKKDSSA